MTNCWSITDTRHAKEKAYGDTSSDTTKDHFLTNNNTASAIKKARTPPMHGCMNNTSQ